MPFQVEKISLEKTNLLSSLMHDYLFEPEKVSMLFTYPFDEKSIIEFIRQKQHQKIDRNTLVNVLLKQAESRNTSSQTLHNIELLKHENTFTLTCAHQPSLLLHPAYYFHKIASTIALSKHLKNILNEFDFVPVFWLGSEDHDWNELGNASILSSKIIWNTAQKGAMGRFVLDEGFKQAMNEFKQLNSSPEKIALFEKALASVNTFGAFTNYMVQEFFNDYGLVVLDQDDKELKQLFVPLIEDEILNSRAENTLKPTLDFLEANYKVQAGVRSINFFHLGKNYRERIVRNNDSTFEVLNQEIKFTEAEIKKDITEHPENYSPNVNYRTLFQEMILPNIAFVGGGGECSYWLQQKPLFDFYKITFPMIIHRTPVVVLEQNIARKIKKLRLKIEQIFNRQDVFIKNFIEENFGEEISLKEAEISLATLYESVERKLAAIDPTLASSVKAEHQKALAGILNLENKGIKALKRRSETVVNQLSAIHDAVFTNGTFQERSLNFLDFPETDELLKTLANAANPLEKNLLILTHSVD